MIKAVLFDLDDTLLGNDVNQTFLPAYFGSLANYMAPYIAPERFLKVLKICTRRLIERIDLSTTNREFFWMQFGQESGLDPAELEPVYDRFCLEEFPKLASITQLRPFAARLVKACQAQQLKVVIATNPLFPAIVIEERLAWAGVPVSDFDYDLVTTYENMHSAKPNVSYYQEILEKIDCDPEAAFMAGDSWVNDILPASTLGLTTYWINKDDYIQPPDNSLIIGQGNLEGLFNHLFSQT